jgi:transglutaminase-like putative cysteine protease
VIYDIRLRLTHGYMGPADIGRHRVRVSPLTLPGWQDVQSVHLSADPDPADRVDGTDFFGNPVTFLAHDGRHTQMQIILQTRVQRHVLEDRFDTSPDLGGLGAEISSLLSVGPGSPHHFVGPSDRISLPDAVAVYARDAIGTGLSVHEGMVALGAALHRDMTFDGSATTVDTPLDEAFANRHGVCQDYAHIMISGLRSLGIPARYVSGFLRTEPPEGQPRLEGADAMHAWVSAWCGRGLGWVEYDPTNGVLVGQDHITVAYGRDYSDVSPIKGMMRGGGMAMISQAVDVIPVV